MIDVEETLRWLDQESDVGDYHETTDRLRDALARIVELEQMFGRCKQLEAAAQARIAELEAEVEKRDNEWRALLADVKHLEARISDLLAQVQARDAIIDQSEPLRRIADLLAALERLLDNGDAPHPLSGREPTVRWEDVESARAAIAAAHQGEEG